MQHRNGKTRAAETAPDGEAPPRRTMAAKDGGGSSDRGAGGVLSQAFLAPVRTHCNTWATPVNLSNGNGPRGMWRNPGRAEPAGKPRFSMAGRHSQTKR